MRGRKRLGEENIRQHCLLLYFLRYDPEEGQTITFYSGARKRRLAAAETERTKVRCDISSISSNLKASLEISAEVAQCFRGVYLLLTFSALKRWMEKKKTKTSVSKVNRRGSVQFTGVGGACEQAQKRWATGLASLG